MKSDCELISNNRCPQERESCMKKYSVQFTLLVCVIVAYAHLLLLYTLTGGSPSFRLNYGIFMSVTPALAALLLMRVKKSSWSRLRAAEVYVLLFVLTSVIQSYGRMISVARIAHYFTQ
jgi:hypothetical protein